MSDPFETIRLMLTARLAALGPKPRWWQRRRRKAWKAAAAKVFAEAFNAAAREIYGAVTIVRMEPFINDSPRARQERAIRIIRGEAN